MINDDSSFCQYCGSAQQVPEAVLASDGDSDGASTFGPDGSSSPTPLSDQPAETHEAFWAQAFGWGTITMLGIVVLMIIVASLNNGSNDEAGSKVASAEEMAEQAVAAAEKAANEAAALTAIEGSEQSPQGQAKSQWDYMQSEDKVRGGTTYIASTTSVNSIRQDFPYQGETTLRMNIRKSPGNGTDAYVVLSSGQLLCDPFDGCSIMVKLDDRSPRRFGMVTASDNSSDILFLQNAKEFIREIENAKTAVVEIELYQAGSPQFEFNVEGLKWEH